MSSTAPSNLNAQEISGPVRHILGLPTARQSIDLEIPLDDSFATVVRLAVAALAEEAGIGQDHTEHAREEMGTVFAELCRSRAARPTARLHAEVGHGALLVEASTSDEGEPVLVRWWAPVPEPEPESP